MPRSDRRHPKTPGEVQPTFDWEKIEPAAAPAEASPAPVPEAPIETGPAAAAGEPRSGYGPGHPWHYLAAGDGADPVPFDEIPASPLAAARLLEDLPRHPVQRLIRAREWLDAAQQELEERCARYVDVIERGAEALSRYDREIAYSGNDELARAGTLALLFNNIAWIRGRVEALQHTLGQRSDSPPLRFAESRLTASDRN